MTTIHANINICCKTDYVVPLDYMGVWSKVKDHWVNSRRDNSMRRMEIPLYVSKVLKVVSEVNSKIPPMFSKIVCISLNICAFRDEGEFLLSFVIFFY